MSYQKIKPLIKKKKLQNKHIFKMANLTWINYSHLIWKYQNEISKYNFTIHLKKKLKKLITIWLEYLILFCHDRKNLLAFKQGRNNEFTEKVKNKRLLALQVGLEIIGNHTSWMSNSRGIKKERIKCI